MFNWIKKMFGEGAKEQVFVAKPKVIVTKTVTKPIIIKPAFKNKKELAKLTKGKMEEIGRTYGVELDKRKKKDALVNELWKAIKK